MGGVDKPALTVGGVPLLDRVLGACSAATVTVVVGPERPTCRPVRWTRESQIGSGPVAALVAGLQVVTAPQVVLLAGDLPFLRHAVVAQLLAAITDDGALLVDETGREQWLCSAWHTEALRNADRGSDRLSRALGALTVTRVALPVAPGEVAPWVDCDTQADLQQARELA
jgi:molybdopterin-guanine dinucleotide biosynthesis protein A